jgi:uncharacterized damage-inducible protein DinB
MNSVELLTDAFERVRTAVHDVVDGLSSEDLAVRLTDDSNSIAWLIWHLTRVQDDHIAEVAGVEQIWTSGGWVERFGLPLPASSTGYGHGREEVAAVRVESGELLTSYYDAVHERTLRYIAELKETDLDRVVDESWTPAVTLGVRLVSVMNDDTQHAGQAAFIRGVILRRP